MKLKVQHSQFKFYIITTFIGFVLPLNSYAFLNKNDVGVSTAQFLKLGMGGQANAMGESVTAIVNDSTSVCWNPSGLNKIQNKHASLMYTMYLENVYYTYWTYAMQIKDICTVGSSLQYVNYGNIKETDEYGSEIGDFNPYDLGITIGLAKELLTGLPIGLNFKYISSKIKNSSSAIGFDIGSQYSLMDNKILLGLVVQNIGTKMKFVDEGSNLPLNIKLGIAYKFLDDLIVEFDTNLPSDNTIIIGSGIQYLLKLNDSWLINIRAGYNTRTIDIGGFKGLSSGFGVKFRDIEFDYAFVPYGNLGITNRVSVGLVF